MKDYLNLEEYWKHTALNMGHVFKHLRFFYTYPETEKRASRGSLKYFLLSFGKRSERVGNNLFYALIPPRSHHSAKELESMRAASARAWFLYGLAPWKYSHPTHPNYVDKNPLK
jgi:hypothetical protein